MEIASQTRDYAWERATPGLRLHTVCGTAVAEQTSFTRVFLQARRKFSELRIEVCFLPSYFPKQSLAALLAAKSLGLKTVMMNETHAGTARATGLSAWLKRRLIGLFDTALVGGAPQKRHFASMGLPEDKIFTGYDAVDNDHFSRRTDEVRGRSSVVRDQNALPEHYFLSLGRFVAKKNLGVLIRAYRQYLDASPSKRTHLVLVGSGEEDPALRALCAELHLPTYDHPAFSVPHSPFCVQTGVHFYGFRQVEENPVFYALADAFILPSLYEEWGLVVNEAMACGLPVIVSQTAGCVEDLFEPGCSSGISPEDRARIEQSDMVSKLRLNGFVFDPSSPKELSRALLTLEGSANLRALMGAESRRIVEKFSCENFARNALLAAEAAKTR
jgi:glycosyltransferase involved in cell wall biosynthesis